jgi:hypothetical protein
MDLHNDIFEVVVDGDLSGGPLIDIYHRDVWTPEAVGQARSVIDPRISRAEAHWFTRGVHAQNYHIFTPPGDKDWAMACCTKDPLRNMGIVPELANSFYGNRSQRGLGDYREEAHPVWNRVCQERGQNQQGQTNHQRAPKQMNERDFLSGDCIHRLSRILCERVLLSTGPRS